MDAQRWREIQSLFLAALDHEPADRSAFVAGSCPGDPELRREVEALLNGHDERRALAIENRLLVDERGSWPDEPDLAGTRIGPYRLVRCIGRGGMGDVFLAEREEPYRQEVAVKLVRPGLDPGQVVRRFQAERQILARLIHPNIARLLDGGVVSDGRPYLVMEYIAGLPITTYCDEQRLSVGDRLRLFRTVCEAVQFAHRNLIVHRDVKPSNVLVTEQGEVKLLDFGIAKLLAPNAGEMSPTVTQTAVRLMTPEYAAPEQVRGETITTATDVYTLGILLYELLTGHHPHPLPKLTPAEVERVICTEEPLWPSTVVGTRGATSSAGAEHPVTPERVSADRRTETARLRRALEGDLDTIVMMALRKEPERRYASATQLTDDIGRYLDGRPVMAQKDTLRYRMSTFVRRHRVGVAVASAVAMLIIGFGIVMGVQAGAIAQERDRVRVEAEKATQVAEFLEDLFHAPDPYASTPDRRDTLRVADFLAQGALKLQSELATQPAVQAQLLSVLGEVFVNLGDLDAAQPLLEQSLHIREDLYGSEHVDVADSKYELAEAVRAKGQYAEAEALLREALATRRALLGSEHADVAASMDALAGLLQHQSDLTGAEMFYRDALAMRRRLFGSEHVDVAASLGNLATLYDQRGDYQEAEPLLREAMAIQREVLGSMHPEVAHTLGNLAPILRQQRKFEEAERAYHEVLDIYRETVGWEHPMVAATVNNLAVLLRTMERYDEAELQYREALRLWRTVQGEEHPNVALGLHNLGAVLKAQGDLAGAEPLYRESLAMRRRLLGDAHPAVAASLNNLGVLMKDQGDRAAADSLLRQAIDVNVTSLGSEHPRVAITMGTLGDLWHDAGRYDLAEPLFVDALAIFRARRPADDANVIRMYERLHQLYRAWDKPEQAARYQELIP